MAAYPEAAHLSGWSRRRFLEGAAGVAGLAVIAKTLEGRAAAARPLADGYPFPLGVASGDPAPDGVVLWTRLAPDPYAPDGGMPGEAARVAWQVAEDEAMRRVVRQGAATALPELAHSVHVELDGLRADREYFYRFRYGQELSPVGRTRTAPAAGAALRELRFGFVSCQDFASGHYSPYRHLAEEDLRLVVHLGDYVYEGPVPADGGYRQTPVPVAARPAPRNLREWRIRYALYKSDPELRAVHARFPFTVTWDDHEVVNDYAGDQSQYQGDISALRAAAYQAYYEHMPLRAASIPTKDGMRLHRRLTYGDLLRFNVLDGRQHRSVPPCGWGEADACEEAYHPSVSMLGAAQERWLLDGLSGSPARWNVLASNVMMGRLDHDGDAGERLWHDAWDGYPAARTRITDHLATADTRNPVVITGDWHSTFVNDIHQDFDRPDSPVVATEFVGTSVSSNGDGEVYGPYYGPMIKYNPHIRFFDGDRRGYVRCTVTPRQWRTDLRMVTTVSRPDAPAYDFASFVVEDGRPGAHRV